jgi:hypothetical protein
MSVTLLSVHQSIFVTLPSPPKYCQRANGKINTNFTIPL